MIIKNIRVTEAEGRVSLLADCKVRSVGWDTVYFTFDKKYKGFIVADGSAFAAGLLIPSMYLGQDLVIEGSISSELKAGMEQIMDTLLKWQLGINLKRITIKATEVVPDKITSKNVGTFFSSGVDSFYTFLKHKDDVTDRVSHLIFIKGSDITLRNKKLLDVAEENTQAVACLLYTSPSPRD